MRRERLPVGEMVIAEAEDRGYKHGVASTQHVCLGNVPVTHQTCERTLTLLTCAAWDTDTQTHSETVTVRADLVSDAPPDPNQRAHFLQQ
jgi:hypothetical protein